MSTGRYARLGCGCIDIHTHVVPGLFPGYAGADPQARWPSMEPARPGHRNVMLAGKVYRTVSEKAWNASVRLEDMDRDGVDVQVLSPMPELLSYWMGPADGAAMCRYLNESTARMVATSPARFRGLAAVPLQDPDAAIRELEHAIGQLGLAGVELGTNIGGKVLGDAAFRPFLEACSALGAAVFVHPLRPCGMDRLVGPAALEQALAFPGEVGLAAMSLVTGGTLQALPRLRIAFSHGGGSVPVLAARLQHAWSAMPALRESMTEAPRALLRRMFFDDLLYDAGAIRALIEAVGDTQVMVGTDYPFAIMDTDPLGRVASVQLDEAQRAALLGGNAIRWLEG